jgi:integrase
MPRAREQVVEILKDGRCRVRWTHPTDLDGQGKKRRYSNSDIIDVPDGEAFYYWLRQRNFQVRPDDPEVVQATWRTGLPVTRTSRNRKTFKEFAYDNIESRGYATEATQHSYKSKLNTAFGDWLPLPMEDINRKMVEKKLAWLKVTYAATTFDKYSKHARGIFADALALGVISTNPFVRGALGERDVLIGTGKKVRGRKNRKSIVISPINFMRILDAGVALDELKAGSRPSIQGYRQTEMILRTFAATCARIGEILPLRVDDFRVFGSDPANEDGSVDLIRSLKRRAGGAQYEDTPKADSDRLVPVEPSFKLLLADYIVNVRGLDPDKDGDAFVFAAPYSKGTKGWVDSGWRRDRWKPLMELAHTQFDLPADVRPTPHSFRHTFARRLLDNGATVYDVSQMLGHINTRTTERDYLDGTEAQISGLRRFLPSVPVRPTLRIVESA